MLLNEESAGASAKQPLTPAAPPGLQLLGDLQNLLRQDRPAAQRVFEEMTRLMQRAAQADDRPSVVPGGLASWQIRQLVRHVDAHLDKGLPLHALAEQVRLSDGHFARAFKRSFGRTPHAYVLERRIARAQAMMLASREPLCAVAVAVGLSDQAHFSRMFRRLVGTTPLAWRRENAEQTERAGQPVPGHSYHCMIAPGTGPMT